LLVLECSKRGAEKLLGKVETLGNALDSQRSEQYIALRCNIYAQSVGRFLGASCGGVKIALINLWHTQAVNIPFLQKQLPYIYGPKEIPY
jgi:hypothetical protein